MTLENQAAVSLPSTETLNPKPQKLEGDPYSEPCYPKPQFWPNKPDTAVATEDWPPIASDSLPEFSEYCGGREVGFYQQLAGKPQQLKPNTLNL